MSTVAAVVTSRFAVVAADTQATCGAGDFGTTKLFEKGDAIIGFCGDTVFRRVIVNFPPCQAGCDEDVEDWCHDLATLIHDFAVSRGLRYDGGEMNLSMAIACRWGIYHVASNGAVDKIDRGHYATGSGGPFANGALAAMTINDSTVIQAAQEAIMIASCLDGHTGRQIETLYLELTDDDAD